MISCDDSKLIQDLNGRIENEFSSFFKEKKCCSSSNIVRTEIIQENVKKDREQITCPGVGSKVLNLKECSDGSFQEIILDSSLYSIDSTSNTVTIQNRCDKEEPPIVLNQNDNNFCVGLKKRETDDGSDDDEDDDYDYDDDDEVLQEQSDEMACKLDPSQTKKDALNKTHILVVRYCPDPCGKASDSNNPMCIRTCSCPKNFVLNKDGKCIKMTQNVKQSIIKIGDESLAEQSKSRRDLAFELGLKLDLDLNFDLVNSMRRQCPEGYRKRYLNPEERCSDWFTIGTAHFNREWCENSPVSDPKNSQVKLMIHNEHINWNLDFSTGDCKFEHAEGLSPDDFCLNIHEEGHYTAEVCEKVPNKYSWYPVILTLSAVFLFATLVIYSMNHGVLINNYTSIVWHFVLNMLLAFITLIINQSMEIKPISEDLCIAIAILQHYFFIASFIFMTVLSVETFWRSRKSLISMSDALKDALGAITAPCIGGAALNDNQQSNLNKKKSKSSDSLLSDTFFFAGNSGDFDRKRHIQEVVSVHAITIFLTILPVTFNYMSYETYDKCSNWRPRFGENKCFYSDRLNKARWFYSWIGLCLFINLIMFIINVCYLIKHRSNFDNLAVTMAKHTLLVVGIGIVWTFEIFSGIFADDETEFKWYFTDVLQMLQGVWIFLAFVIFNPSAREELKLNFRGGERRQEASNGDQAQEIPLVDDVDNRKS